jgi:hypothetical protein
VETPPRRVKNPCGNGNASIRTDSAMGTLAKNSGHRAEGCGRQPVVMCDLL